MSLLITGLSGPTRGIETDVVGIVCDSFAVKYFLEVLDYLAGITGESVARAASAKLARTVTLSGAVSGATGVMAATFTTAVTTALGNDVATWGDGTGGLYVTEANEIQGSGAWRSMSMTLDSRPLIA